VDHADSDGWTALMLAARAGHAQCLELLLRAGANVDHEKSDGWTALMFAANAGYTQCLALLLSEGASVDHADSDGWTALMLAARAGHAQCLELLLSKGANVNHAKPNGSTALMMAAQGGHAQCLALLLRKGATVDHAYSKYGWTALMIAAHKGHAQCVGFLLCKGANVNHAISNGQTVLMLAAQKKHHKVIELMLTDQRTDLHARDQEGATALCHALNTSSRDCVMLLLEAGASFLDNTSAPGWRSETQRALHSQNIHLPEEVEVIQTCVVRARQLVKREPRLQEPISRGFLEQKLHALNVSQLASVRSLCGGDGATRQGVLEMSDVATRSTVMAAIARFYDKLTSVPGATAPSGPDVLALVHGALSLALSEAYPADYDECEYVLIPIFAGLLQCAHQYAVGGQTCAVGAIDIIAGLLRGRLEACKASSAGDETSQQLPVNVTQLLEKLDDVSVSVGLCSVLAEAHARLIALVHADAQEASLLRGIFEDAFDDELFDWAMNKLRGLLFRSLQKEFGEDLAKAMATADPEIIGTGERELLRVLSGLASRFCAKLQQGLPRSLREIVEGLPCATVTVSKRGKLEDERARGAGGAKRIKKEQGDSSDL